MRMHFGCCMLCNSTSYTSALATQNQQRWLLLLLVMHINHSHAITPHPPARPAAAQRRLEHLPCICPLKQRGLSWVVNTPLFTGGELSALALALALPSCSLLLLLHCSLLLLLLLLLPSASAFCFCLPLAPPPLGSPPPRGAPPFDPGRSKRARWAASSPLRRCGASSPSCCAALKPTGG
jgi:hypothetical protein